MAEQNAALLEEQVSKKLAPATKAEYRRLMGKKNYNWAKETDRHHSLFDDIEDGVRPEIENIKLDFFVANEQELLTHFVAWYSRKPKKGSATERDYRAPGGQNQVRSAIVWFLNKHGRKLQPATEETIKAVRRHIDC
jgi:hypothetical protein